MGGRQRNTERARVRDELDGLRDQITAWYIDEKLTTLDVQERLKACGLSPTAGQVQYALYRFGLKRPRNTKSPRLKTSAAIRVYSHRECQHCYSEYQPNGATQIYCVNCCPEPVFWRRIKCYGIGKKEYDALWKIQAGKCGICKENLQNVKIDVDHDHVTGRVRGLLCHQCNLNLHVIENQSFVQNAQAYLVKYSQQLG